ncbi:unnamed protein product [Leuciscus chuanchicus]
MEEPGEKSWRSPRYGDPLRSIMEPENWKATAEPEVQGGTGFDKAGNQHGRADGAGNHYGGADGTEDHQSEVEHHHSGAVIVKAQSGASKKRNHHVVETTRPWWGQQSWRPCPAADRDAITAVEEEEEEEGPTRLTVTAEDKRTDGAEKCTI